MKIVSILIGSCLFLASLNAGPIKVETEHAPKAIGPYSQAVRIGSTLYISGQIGIDPATGKLAGETIEIQTAQILANIQAILETQKATFQNVVKTTVYLKDLNDFQVMNGLYAQKFEHAVKPARATVQVAKLPLDARVEIECIAHIE